MAKNKNEINKKLKENKKYVRKELAFKLECEKQETKASEDIILFDGGCCG